MRPADFDIFKTIEALEGNFCAFNSCLPPGMVEEDLTEHDKYILDNNLFYCDGCGYWKGLEECSSNGECYECNPDDDEEN